MKFSSRINHQDLFTYNINQKNFLTYEIKHNIPIINKIYNKVFITYEIKHNNPMVNKIVTERNAMLKFTHYVMYNSFLLE